MQRHNSDYRIKTGRRWVNVLSRILSNAVIVLSCVFIVLLACDLFLKGEMSFIANTYSKVLLLVMCIIAGINSLIQLRCLGRLSAIRKYMGIRRRRG